MGKDGAPQFGVAFGEPSSGGMAPGVRVDQGVKKMSDSSCHVPSASPMAPRQAYKLSTSGRLARIGEACAGDAHASFIGQTQQAAAVHAQPAGGTPGASMFRAAIAIVSMERRCQTPSAFGRDLMTCSEQHVQLFDGDDRWSLPATMHTSASSSKPASVLAPSSVLDGGLTGGRRRPLRKDLGSWNSKSEYGEDLLGCLPSKSVTSTFTMHLQSLHMYNSALPQGTSSPHSHTTSPPYTRVTSPAPVTTTPYPSIEVCSTSMADWGHVVDRATLSVLALPPEADPDPDHLAGESALANAALPDKTLGVCLSHRSSYQTRQGDPVPISSGSHQPGGNYSAVAATGSAVGSVDIAPMDLIANAVGSRQVSAHFVAIERAQSSVELLRRLTDQNKLRSVEGLLGANVAARSQHQHKQCDASQGVDGAVATAAAVEKAGWAGQLYDGGHSIDCVGAALPLDVSLARAAPAAQTQKHPASESAPIVGGPLPSSGDFLMGPPGQGGHLLSRFLQQHGSQDLVQHFSGLTNSCVTSRQQSMLMHAASHVTSRRRVSACTADRSLQDMPGSKSKVEAWLASSVLCVGANQEYTSNSNSADAPRSGRGARGVRVSGHGRSGNPSSLEVPGAGSSSGVVGGGGGDGGGENGGASEEGHQTVVSGSRAEHHDQGSQTGKGTCMAISVADRVSQQQARHSHSHDDGGEGGTGGGRAHSAKQGGGTPCVEAPAITLSFEPQRTACRGRGEASVDAVCRSQSGKQHLGWLVQILGRLAPGCLGAKLSQSD